MPAMPPPLLCFLVLPLIYAINSSDSTTGNMLDEQWKGCGFDAC